jgi:hypothetical protein
MKTILKETFENLKYLWRYQKDLFWDIIVGLLIVIVLLLIIFGI